MPVWINSSNDEPVKEFFTEVSSVKLVTKLVQVVLHHPFTDHMEGLHVLFEVTDSNMNPFEVKIALFCSRDFSDINIDKITQI